MLELVLLAVRSYTTPEIFDYAPKVVFHGNESALNYGEPHNGTRESPHAHTFDFWPADMYKEPFNLVKQVERATVHPNAAPHFAFGVIWVIWYGTTKVRACVRQWVVRAARVTMKNFPSSPSWPSS